MIMKKLDLRNSANKELLAEFERHLQTLNYSKDTVYNAANGVKEYLHFLESKGKNLQEVTTEVIAFFDYLKTRPNERRGAGLSASYLQKQRSLLKLFYEFLQKSRGVTVPTFPDLPKPKRAPKYLSRKEVEQLFKTCDTSLQGKRDKALLAIYYGCGLRRKEGAQLNVEDIDLSRGEIFVRQSKTRRQRYVPISPQTQKLIEDYLFNARELMLPDHVSEGAFLISNRGKRMQEVSVDYALKQIKERTENQAIKEKLTGLHTLRHSIATHLLQAGMKLEDIAMFLGHRSLDSTQVYTHLMASVSNETITTEQL